MTADELDDVTAERDQLRADLHTQRHAPFVEGNEHRRAETIVVMERGLGQLQALLDGDPVCERCEDTGFDGHGEPCSHMAEPDPDAAHDWDRDTRALDEVAAAPASPGGESVSLPGSPAAAPAVQGDDE